jgi:hypothetical protein
MLLSNADGIPCDMDMAGCELTRACDNQVESEHVEALAAEWLSNDTESAGAAAEETYCITRPAHARSQGCGFDTLSRQISISCIYVRSACILDLGSTSHDRDELRGSMKQGQNAQ